MEVEKEQNQSLHSEKNNNCPVLLIYYNFRGIGQMIRYLLIYIGLPFIDIHLDQYQQQKNSLPQQVLLTLRSKSVNKNDLPAIIHNNEIIYDLNQIMNYVCITFGREDLLGCDIFAKAKVCEIQEMFSLRLSPNIKFLSAFVTEVQQSALQDLNLLQFIQRRLSQFFSVSGYSKELSDELIRQGDTHFVLGNFTIIDFYYVQHCRFAVRLFGNIDQELAQGSWASTAANFRREKESKGQRVQNIQNLRVMKKFIDFFSSQTFYQKNQRYFDSFNFFPKAMSGAQVQGMKKLQANYFLDLYYGNNG